LKEGATKEDSKNTLRIGHAYDVEETIRYASVADSFLQRCEMMDMQFENNPRGNFDALWTILDRNYCFFEYKNIDWDSVYTAYGARITSNMSNDALFKLMGEMLAEA